MSFSVVLRRLRERWLGGVAHAGTRRGRASRPVGQRMRSRLQLEALEDRTLMSVLPAPLVTGQTILPSTSPNIGATGNIKAPNSNARIAVDPNNPQAMVAVWTSDTTTIFTNVDSVVQAAYSTNGGQSW